jgi:2-dehydropantoate 2-reductase
MKIGIAGAGAIGSVIAGYLLADGRNEVSVLARGAHLAAMRSRGLTILTPGSRRLESRPVASDNPGDLGPQDVIISTVKGHGVSALAPLLGPMRKPGTPIVAAQNGIPWWYFRGVDGPEADQPFEVVDPGGVAWRTLGPENAIGCVINLPAEIVEPGVVHHVGKPSLTLGAPRQGDHVANMREIAAALESAGVAAPMPADVRHPLWIKLQQNTSSGPVSVLTGANLGAIGRSPGIRALRAKIMRECIAVAARWNVVLEDDIDARLSRGSGGADNHKASMLQDYEMGKPIELDPVATATIDLAHRRGVPVPMLETVTALTKLKIGAG